jgi:hypothetical protein
MQIWTVGSTGYYDMLAGGASGASFFPSNWIAGRGIVTKSRQYLQEGETIIILIGMCNTHCDTRYSGGGGGTYISKYAATDTFDVRSQHNPLLVAGGGGGISVRDPFAGIDGTLTQSGTKCTFNPPSNAASNGGGGGAYGTDGGNGLNGETYSYFNGGGGGGGGFVGNGGSAAGLSSFGAKSFLRGGRGGLLDSYSSICTVVCIPDPTFTCGYNAGGFGGGGEGTAISGGGGGGYSGGQGCAAPDYINNFQGSGGGGGGGSYEANAAATQYTVWDDSQFGPIPASFSNGYMSLHGIAAVNYPSIIYCAVDTYLTGSTCQSCVYCDIGKYAKGCGGSTPGVCSNCTNGF